MMLTVPGPVADVLDRFAKRVRAEVGAELVSLRLFGSYARGEAHEDSDIDVLVLVKQMDFARKRTILDIAGDVWAETGLWVSPLVMDVGRFETWRQQERRLARDIEREGSFL